LILLHKDRLLDSAQKFLAKGQLAKAIGEYQKLVDAFPRDYRHLQKLAELLCREQRYSEALPHLEKVAENFTATGFYLKAIAIYKQIQKIDPARIATSQQIAELYERQGLIGTALSEYRQQFLTCERNGQIEEALDLLLKMIHLDPDNTALRCRLIETLLALGEEPKALVAFQELASLLAAKDEQAAIARLYEQFPGLCPGDAASQQPPASGSDGAAANIAPELSVTASVGQSVPPSAVPETVPAAEPIYELELELELDGLEGLGEVPSALSHNGAPGGVTSGMPPNASAVIPVDQGEDDDIEVLSEFMIFEDDVGETNLAEERSGPATAGTGYEESQSHFDLGIAYKEMGRYQSAIEEFDKAALDPDRLLDCLNLKGQCLVDQGEVAAADLTFRTALAHPEVTDTMRMVLHYELGLLYEHGRPLEALEHFQFVAEKDQFFRDVAAKLQELRRRLGLDDPPPSSSGGQSDSDRISYI